MPPRIAYGSKLDKFLRVGSVVALACAILVAVIAEVTRNSGSVFDDYRHRPQKNRTAAPEDSNPNHTSSGFMLALGGNLLRPVRIFSFPLLLIAAFWSLALAPKSAASFLATCIPALRRAAAYAVTATSRFVPLYPRNLSEALRLGRLENQLDHAKTAAEVIDIVKKAHQVVGRTTVGRDGQQERKEKTESGESTGGVPAASAAAAASGENIATPGPEYDPTQLRDIERICVELDERKGVFRRLFGLLKFTALVQVIALVGIFFTIRPFLERFVTPLLIELCTRLYHEVLLPLHNNVGVPYVYEPSLYGGALLFAVESARYPVGDPLSFAGTGEGTVALMMAVASWLWTTHRVRDQSNNELLWQTISLWMLVAASASLAILHQSQLVGYVTSFAAVRALGVSAFSNGLCLIVGFSKRSELERTCVACAVLSLVNVVLRVLLIDNGRITPSPLSSAPASSSSSSSSAVPHVDESKNKQSRTQHRRVLRLYLPFQNAIGVVSSGVLFLGLLILAESEDAHVQFIVAWLLYAFTGHGLGLDGMAHAATAWGVLYMFTRLCILLHRHTAQATAPFCMFLALFIVSRYFNRNPRLITAALFGSADDDKLLMINGKAVALNEDTLRVIANSP